MQHGETTMKNSNPSQYQFAVDVKRKHSRRNFEDYWEVEFLDKDSGALRKTYVTESMRNYVMWQHLLLHMDDHPGKAVCISGKFKCVKGKTDILNADVKFSHEFDSNIDDTVYAIYDMYYA
jgi:hypothetical protein